MFRESEKGSWLNDDDDDDDDTIITGRFRSECFWFSPKIKKNKKRLQRNKVYMVG